MIEFNSFLFYFSISFKFIMIMNLFVIVAKVEDKVVINFLI